jgi:glycosyltransferase involved in cell wall biosynthesis
MKTIAIDIRLIGRNRTGDEAVFRNLVRSLIDIDHTNRYLLLTDLHSKEVESTLLPLITNDGILPENAEVVVLAKKGRFVWNLLSMPMFLIRNNVDVFHTQYILPIFVPRRTKVVAHIHDVSFKVFPEYIGIMDQLFLSLFIPRTMRRSDLLVAPSLFTRDEILSQFGVSERKIVIIPNALDPSFLLRPTGNDISRVRSEYGLPDIFVLSVGTMQPRKNIPLLIHALARMKQHIPAAKLVLVGGKGGRHYDRLIDDAIHEEHLEDSVVFPGYVRQTDMPAFYASATVLAFPSRYEGFGIPLLEAFSAGIPVLASDIPPFREVGGDAVSYFDPSDIAACADSLYTLFIDENTRLRQEKAGKDRLERYSWSESAQEMVSSYNSLVPHKS